MFLFVFVVLFLFVFLILFLQDDCNAVGECRVGIDINDVVVVVVVDAVVNPWTPTVTVTPKTVLEKHSFALPPQPREVVIPSRSFKNNNGRRATRRNNGVDIDRDSIVIVARENNSVVFVPFCRFLYCCCCCCCCLVIVIVVIVVFTVYCLLLFTVYCFLLFVWTGSALVLGFEVISILGTHSFHEWNPRNPRFHTEDVRKQHDTKKIIVLQYVPYYY